jgi:hypothetical protein
VYDDKCEMVFTTGSPDSNQAYRWAGGHNTSAINGQTRQPKLAFVTGRTWSSNVIGVDQLTTHPRTPLAKPGSARSEEYDSQGVPSGRQSVLADGVLRFHASCFFGQTLPLSTGSVGTATASKPPTRAGDHRRRTRKSLGVEIGRSRISRIMSNGNVGIFVAHATDHICNSLNVLNAMNG